MDFVIEPAYDFLQILFIHLVLFVEYVLYADSIIGTEDAAVNKTMPTLAELTF